MIDQFNDSEWMLLILGVIAFGVVLSLWRLQRDESIPFDLMDLLLENGKVSRIACIVMTTFLVTTWAFIYDVLKRKGLDVAILGAYGGLWIIPLVAKLFGVQKSAAQPPA